MPILLSARTPEWLNGMPKNSMYYWGIGISELSNVNYKDVAKHAALEEITQQISIMIENNSFLSIQETNLDVQEDFQQYVRTSSQVYLEDLQIFDFYQDKKNYYVCYRLDKGEYSAKREAKSQEIAKSAYEYLQQAQKAEGEGNLLTAIKYYQKGLEIVEPWLFLNLSYMSENVPMMLYSHYIEVFNGLTITLSPQSATVRNLKSTNIEIVAKLSKNGIPIRGISLKSIFKSGSGIITSSSKTNEMGEGRFFLTNVSSKDVLQSVLIYIDNSIFTNLPRIYQDRSTSQQLPQALFLINVEQQNIVFYINAINNDIPPFLAKIKSVLSNEYVELTTNLEEATHILNVTTDLRKVGVVHGDLGNLDEWLAAFNITLKTKSGNTLTHYAEEDIRVLVPEESSQTIAVQQASKELTKRFKREFPQRLSNMNFY